MVAIQPLTHLPAQENRLLRFNALESVDIHCHCLPGLDDGPGDMLGAVALCRALVEDGITAVIATPHQLGRYEGSNPPQEVRRVARLLEMELQRCEVPLQVKVGADVRLDERLVELLANDQILTLADDGRYLLLELPHHTLIDPRPSIALLAKRGVRAILSHPERQARIAHDPDLVAPWVESGMLLQLTAASVIGDFGRAVQQAAWHLLKRGWVTLVATDAHDLDRRAPRMSAAIELIGAELGHGLARRICVENPARVWRGEDLPGQRLLSPARAG